MKNWIRHFAVNFQTSSSWFSSVSTDRRSARPPPPPSSWLPNSGPRPGGLFSQPQLRNQSGTSSPTTLQHLDSAHFSQKLVDLLNVTAAETGCWFTQEESPLLTHIFGRLLLTFVVYKLTPAEVRALLNELVINPFLATLIFFPFNCIFEEVSPTYGREHLRTFS